MRGVDIIREMLEYHDGEIRNYEARERATQDNIRLLRKDLQEANNRLVKLDRTLNDVRRMITDPDVTEYMRAAGYPGFTS